tara:strand:+ start:6326 stop:6673 length:348 start_codon:yes stop_codon:yes gene_type:complete
MNNKVELTGTVINYSEKTGESAKGTWKRQNIVVRTPNEFKNEIPVGFFNKDLDVKLGDEVTLTAFVGGRKYEDRWYLDLDGDTLAVVSPAKVKGKAPEPTTQPVGLGEVDEQLPF